MRLFLRLSVLTLLAIASTALAAPVKVLVWEDLVPRFSEELKNPFEELELSRQLELETILWARSLTEEERGADDVKAGLEDAAAYERELVTIGIDIDKKMLEYEAWQKAVEERGKQIVPELEGRPVRLAGYLLPLEFSETGQTEFLLVPYVGACIHAPVPPPNQIVFVETKQSFKSEELFTAVWVTGTMRTKISSKALSFVDGTADIPLGYSLEGARVDIYAE